MTNLNRNVRSFTKGDDILPVTHVIVYYGTDSNGKALYKEATSTTDNGRTIEKTVSMFTDGTIAQTIANTILSGYNNCPYHSFEASGAELDPAIELFDGITVNSVVSALGAIDTTFGRGMFADISAQGIEEEDDFPYQSSAQRLQSEVERTQQTVSMVVTNTASEISAVNTRIDEFGTELQDYIRYSNGTLELGKVGNDVTAKLTNSQLGFYENDQANPVAYIGNKMLNITKARVVSEIQIGHLVFVQRSDGDVAVKWRTTI